MADPSSAAAFAPLTRIAIIGIGLIGSSIAQGLRANGFTGHIAICDREGRALEAAQAMGLGDSYGSSAAKAVTGADLVVLCIPVGAMVAAARAIAPTLKEGAIVTDTGSVKASVLESLTAHLPAHARIIPGHPIAGSERSGPDAGWATLFQNRWTVLTPPDGADDEAIEIVQRFWGELGANVELMDVKRHDLVLAITSHLPHLIAYNIVRTAADMEEVTEAEVIKFSAGGFRDFTRIAASDPTMWRDVFLTNRDAVLETLGRFSEDLAMLQRNIRWREGEELFDIFERTRAIRMGIIDAGQDTAAPNFGRPESTDEDKSA
ncbi:MAG: prephenate/arogenate dehydrogenase family protein [Pseudomonadota bacterium]